MFLWYSISTLISKTLIIQELAQLSILSFPVARQFHEVLVAKCSMTFQTPIFSFKTNNNKECV